ncbi:NAD-dependent succinate-semialdehyde dehydrogenase [Candidatus Saccharibacteria bacterium]|jgi:succinate-semialdehyde dehydrogenase/glutarate-semialdehyde dehydrogenase|nr:NAD-dependent succinate-semialdehyde dehydrogenase [Candidatus Saccharibacteria bacterium]
MKSINPVTEELLKEYNDHSGVEVDTILKSMQQDWLSWRQTEFSERAEYMIRMAEILEDNTEKYSKLMTDEMGKTVIDGISEIKKCAWACRYYAAKAEEFLTDELIETDRKKSYISYQPIGIVLAIMPWNFPFWQVIRQIAPSLMAGNGLALKHASNVPGCALAIEALVQEAGFPENIMRTLLVPGRETEPVINHPLVKAVAITGSTPAGRQVASTAGHALKKTVLELGGSDPYIVLADADLEFAAKTCAASRLINAGQSCVAAKRFIVEDSVYEEFSKLFVDAMRSAEWGDPNKSTTKVGPMARRDLRDELHEQVVRTISAGAQLLLGGEKPTGRGAYYPPTVLGGVRKGMPAYSEELFGPVATLIRASDEIDAIQIANDTVFGLGGAIFTKDVEKGERYARNEIQSGVVAVNNMVMSDPRLPFGGIKESGYGRELSSVGIHEFVNIKTVTVD